MQDDKLYDLKEVLRRYPVSQAQWYRGMREGRYPPGEKKGKRGRRFWSPREIKKLIVKGEYHWQRDRAASE